MQRVISFLIRFSAVASAPALRVLIAAILLALSGPLFGSAQATQAPRSHHNASKSSTHMHKQHITPRAQTIHLLGPGQIALHEGQASGEYTIQASDGSTLNWSLATSAGIWGHALTDASAPAFLVIDQSASDNVAQTLTFHIEAQTQLLPGEFGPGSFTVRASDPGRHAYGTFVVAYNLEP